MTAVLPMARNPRPSQGVILLSGGLDSVTTLALARHQGVELWALSLRYGQRHEVELQCAARQARCFGARAHEIVDLSDLSRLLSGATSLLTQSPLAVPLGDPGAEDRILSTYVPARNTLFLACGLAWAEALQVRSLWLGVNAIDYSGYPDCRPNYLDAFARLANLATRFGIQGIEADDGAWTRTPVITLHTPLLGCKKSEIIARGHELGVDFADTVSCYHPEEREGQVYACGQCASCLLRQRGFQEAGLVDPAPYRENAALSGARERAGSRDLQ